MSGVTLERHLRDEGRQLIRQLGGRAASSVSKQTDYLVAGENPVSKLAKARQLGLDIRDEQEFLRLAGRST